MTAKGPGFQPLGAIPSQAATPNLLTSARKLPAGTKWQTGVAFRSTLPLNASRRAFCASGDLVAAADFDKPEFYPYLVYVPYECDEVLDVPIKDNEGNDIWVPNYEIEALNALEQMTAWHMSRELWMGDTEADNPSLVNTASDVSAASAVHPDTALGTLIEAFWDCSQGAVPTIHAPIAAVTSLMSHGLCKQVGDVYYGPGGSVISPGPGYPTATTGTGPGGANAGTGNVWMYVTGPVEYEMNPGILYPDRAEAFFDRRTNRYEITAQRLAIHRFDTTCVFACKTYVPSPGQGETP